MTDSKLRELERRWKETQSVEDEAAYLLERVRVGDLTSSQIRLAAYSGSGAAQKTFILTDEGGPAIRGSWSDLFRAVGVAPRFMPAVLRGLLRVNELELECLRAEARERIQVVPRSEWSVGFLCRVYLGQESKIQDKSPSDWDWVEGLRLWGKEPLVRSGIALSRLAMTVIGNQLIEPARQAVEASTAWLSGRTPEHARLASAAGNGAYELGCEVSVRTMEPGVITEGDDYDPDPGCLALKTCALTARTAGLEPIDKNMTLAGAQIAEAAHCLAVSLTESPINPDWRTALGAVRSELVDWTLGRSMS